MKVINTKFQGLKIIQHNRFSDKRGSLRETYRKKIVKWNDLIFDFATTSKKNAFRGFHFQYKNQQAKYVSVLKGKILDCVIDLRKKSKTFGKYFMIELSEKNSKSIFIPAGFAHGFLCLDKENYVVYSCTNYRHEKSEVGIVWNDHDLKIKWPNKKPLISLKDKNNISFNEYQKKFIK